MNASVPIILAHGEQLVLPALLLILALVFIVYPAALWVLLSSRDRSRSRSRILCAVLVVLVCGVGGVATLNDFTWPPDWGDYIGLLIWVIPLCCGVAALLKSRRPITRDDSTSS